MYTVFIEHNWRKRYTKDFTPIECFSFKRFKTETKANQFVLKTNMTSGMTGDTAEVYRR